MVAVEKLFSEGKDKEEGWQSLVYCTGLENRRTARYRGFESLPLRPWPSQAGVAFVFSRTLMKLITATVNFQQRWAFFNRLKPGALTKR